jgi:hypothetical protein
MCVVTPIELILSEHTQEPMQFIPFILCGLGLIAILAALFRPQRSTILVLRVVMSVAAFGGLLGVWEHLEANWSFVLEIQPNVSTMIALAEALQGASPILAPGILGVMAIIAILATYYHPALGSHREI